MDEHADAKVFDADVIRRNINSWVVGDTAGGTGEFIGDGDINYDPDDSIADDQPEASLFVL